MKKPKYMRRVFSGKDTPMIGLDQGKSELYRGDGVMWSSNFYYESALSGRNGQVLDSVFGGSINSAGVLTNDTFVCEGTNIWM